MTNGYRDLAQELLRSIAALDETVGPIELVNTWFDDFAKLGADPAVDQSFSPKELSVLKQFHAVYSSVADSLTEDSAIWKADADWRKVSGAAKEALHVFERTKV